MDSNHVRSIRTELGLSTLELAEQLGVPQALVLDWESATRFPTLKHARALTRLQTDGVNKPLNAIATNPSAMLPHWLDPGWAELLRKLFSHPELYTEATRLAQRYQDPAQATETEPREATEHTTSLKQPLL